MGVLLDTNVVSELTKEAPNPRVVSFLAEQDDLWLSSVVIYELEYGLRLLPEGRRRNLLAEAQAGILAAYSGRILPLSQASAEWAAILRARALRSGRTVDIGDLDDSRHCQSQRNGGSDAGMSDTSKASGWKSSTRGSGRGSVVPDLNSRRLQGVQRLTLWLLVEVYAVDRRDRVSQLEAHEQPVFER